MVSHSVLELGRKNYLGFQGGNPNLKQPYFEFFYSVTFSGQLAQSNAIITKLAPLMVTELLRGQDIHPTLEGCPLRSGDIEKFCMEAI
jgi:hypothetical protein